MDEPPPAWHDEIARVKSGDEAAARRLVDALYPKVVRIVRNHLPVTEDEEDLCQEVFMKMFSRLGQFRAEQPFDHWVARIALNTCLDKLRRQKARRVRSFSDFTGMDADCLQDALVAREFGDHPTGMSSAAALEVVDRLLATLKPAEQMVIRLLDLEEHSVAEVCARTGWGASRVKVTAFRARRKLAATFKELEAAAAI